MGKGGLLSSGMLHGIGWQLVSCVLEQPVSPIFICQAVQKDYQEEMAALLYKG